MAPKKKQAAKKNGAPPHAKMLGQSVLVRDNRAGIHVGTLDDYNPAAKYATLSKARKVWYWSGAASCHGIAERGLNHANSKVGPVVTLVSSTDVVEVVLCSEAGAASVATAPEWKP